LDKTSGLPNTCVEFLTKVANGALLYYGLEYGQWGYEIFNLQDYFNKQRYWRENLILPTDTPYIAFCKLHGENTVLVIDTSDVKQSIFEANCYFAPTDWTKVANSLEEWLDRLIESEGAKYWD